MTDPGRDDRGTTTVKRAAAAACLLTLLLAGCTQKSRTGADNPVVSAPTTADSSATVATASSTPAPVTTAASTPMPSPSTARPKPSSSASIEAGGCPTSALTVLALRGSGAAGHQFAFLQFTNNSARECSLTGYPGVQLLAGGSPLGAPAQRSGMPVTTVRIAPGASVTASITDDSTCNAAVSDSVQVIPPNRTERIVLKLALRGCPLHVDPVSAS
jgi:hypothetical protein